VILGKKAILYDINLHIHCGELTALIGPNGAGKSTLLKAILGEIRHTGRLKYVKSTGIDSKRPVIGYVPQQLDFDKGTPASVFDLFMACVSRMPVWLLRPAPIRRRVAEALERVEAGHLIDRKLGALSGGELQKVLLALALDPIPDLLLLDEPVSGVDRKGLELFYNMVAEIRNKYDLSIILVSHDLELVERYADRAVLLSGTVLCSGKPSEVFGNKQAGDIFGSSVHRLANMNNTGSGGEG
jgi:zinc transport system ATP-binding protein